MAKTRLLKAGLKEATLNQIWAGRKPASLTISTSIDQHWPEWQTDIAAYLEANELQVTTGTFHFRGDVTTIAQLADAIRQGFKDMWLGCNQDDLNVMVRTQLIQDQEPDFVPERPDGCCRFCGHTHGSRKKEMIRHEFRGPAKRGLHSPSVPRQ